VLPSCNKALQTVTEGTVIPSPSKDPSSERDRGVGSNERGVQEGMRSRLSIINRRRLSSSSSSRLRLSMLGVGIRVRRGSREGREGERSCRRRRRRRRDWRVHTIS